MKVIDFCISYAGWEIGAQAAELGDMVLWRPRDLLRNDRCDGHEIAGVGILNGSGNGLFWVHILLLVVVCLSIETAFWRCQNRENYQGRVGAGICSYEGVGKGTA